MSNWTDSLQHIACADGIEDGRQYATFADWWRGTQRSDYMLWLLERMGYPDDRKLRLLACRFVRGTRVDDTRTVWDLLTDERSRSAVEVAERYAVGEARKGELEAAARAAWSAAQAAASSAEWAAARAAASAAAWPPTSAATSAARATAMKSALAQQADIIRDMIPVEEIAPLFERYIERLQGGDR